MLRRLKHKLKIKLRIRRSEDGQAITEYGAILAFIAVLVALVFAFGSSDFSAAVSNCFSSITKQLNDMATTSAAAS
jgi:Flp pilus assembly pilin Flp